MTPILTTIGLFTVLSCIIKAGLKLGVIIFIITFFIYKTKGN